MERKFGMLFIFLVIYVPSVLFELIYGCPISCTCKWKGGKQFVECSNKELITIPDGMDPGTQVLDFSGNNLQSLQKETFRKRDLINLQRIYLSRCKITRIDDRAFIGLRNLIELDLSMNSIMAIPSTTFINYPSLMRLTLNENPIQIIRNYAFHDLPSLNILELSNCEIEIIEDEAFAGLNNLEWLKLNGNRLTHIKGADVLPISLHGIDLQHNRWICDCRLLELHNWLLNFKIPHAVEPKCTRPTRLAGRTIKSVSVDDLACLPDISPTTLYLEIGEGKNISLLCKVSAIPAAHVSWWFQGQLLQNDTTIAPGYHLLYYIEEGTIEKRSELFIYNTNTVDNGTFICAAENSAGKALSNYTIRVIVKEEPIVAVVPFPIEYFVAIASGASAFVLIVVIGIIMAIIKCRRRKQVQKKKKKEPVKEINLQNQQNVNKCSVLCDSTDPMTEPIKVNGSVSERQLDNTLYASLSDETIMIDVSTVSVGNQYRSPPPVKNFSNEQNPDLINDTESVGKGHRRDNDNDEIDITDNSGHSSYQEAMDNVIDEFDPKNTKLGTRHVQWQDTAVVYSGGIATLPRSGSHELYQHAADVHLNPGCLMDSDGYPIDFGLPKKPMHPIQTNSVRTSVIPAPVNYFYRTLPHNRSKMTPAAISGIRYSREAKFLSRSSQATPYEHYNPSTDVRYTVEGYPCSKPLYSVAPQTNGIFSNESDTTFIPSPPEGYKTNDQPVADTCCKSPPQSQLEDERSLSPHWSPCMFAGAFESSPHCTIITPRLIPQQTQTVRRCSVGAQTESGEKTTLTKSHKISSTSSVVGVINSSSSHHGVTHEVLTESPDEGYVGDGNEAIDI